MVERKNCVRCGAFMTQTINETRPRPNADTATRKAGEFVYHVSRWDCGHCGRVEVAQKTL